MTRSQQGQGVAARVVRALRRLVGSRGAHVAPPKSDPRLPVPRPEGFEPIRLPLAGVMHQNRRRTVQRLALGEPVWLRRDPTNSFDPNAIAVGTQTGKRLGYVGRNVATGLAPYMDEHLEPLRAVVTELTTDISAAVVGAAISLYLPAQLVATLLGSAQGWEFCCDTAADGATYLMLNCDEAELTRVSNALRRQGLQFVRSGLSYSLAPDGRQYRWYVRLEGECPEQTLSTILNDTLGASRRYIDANRWIAEFDSENARLSAENTALRVETTDLRGRVSELQRVLDSPLRQQRVPPKRGLDIILKTLLPRLVLLRDSLDVMERELESYEPVLRELRVLCWTPSEVRAERVESAPEWKERHFSTGQKDVGRLYFRQGDGTWMVLVSFKQYQARDVQYLKQH